MGLKDIASAVEAYKKLTKEERVLFTIEAGRRRGRKPGPKGKGKARKVRARHVAEDAVPVKQVLAKKPRKGREARQVVDPAAQVTQES